MNIGFDNIPEPLLPEGENFVDFNPIEVARQICLYEQNFFSNMTPREFLNQSWINDKNNSPNISKLISFNIEVSKWVASLIVSQTSMEKRSKILKQLMQVSIELFNLCNFNSCMGIVNGLNSPSITRLKLTWGQTKKKYAKIANDFDQIINTMTLTSNYQKYRNHIKNSTPPCIPCIPVYINDLNNIEGESKNFNMMDSFSFINVDKMNRIGELISEIWLYKQQTHRFQKVNQIYEFFDRGLFYMEEEQISTKSRELEPNQLDSIGGTQTKKHSKSEIYKKSKKN